MSWRHRLHSKLAFAIVLQEGEEIISLAHGLLVEERGHSGRISGRSWRQQPAADDVRAHTTRLL